MKELYLTRPVKRQNRWNAMLGLLLALCCFTSPAALQAQCTTATIDWDFRNYLVTTGNYSGFVTSAMAQSQNFSLGTNMLNIAMGTGITSTGQNTGASFQTGSFGSSGTAVAYNGNGSITLTLDTAVSNFQFSLYDIDNGQTVTVTAKDQSNNPLNVTMVKVTGTVLTVTGSGTIAPSAASTGSSTPTADAKGALNITVAGSSPAGTGGVSAITITTAGVSGDFWLSDISACVMKSFSTNYYQYSKPWTGQPAYTIANSNAATASLVNLSTGKARFIFQDGGTGSNPYINSFGWDQVNHKLYYTYDSSGSGSGVSYSTKAKYKAVRLYDMNGLTGPMTSGTKSTIIADVTASPLFIPVFDQGLTSGGGAFYDGSFYLGVEGTNSNVSIGGKKSVSNRYSMIWRIDFDATGNPTQACQVFAWLADDGNQHNTHDWGDFGIVDGVMYDFNSAGSTTSTSYNKFISYDLQTGDTVRVFSPNGSPVPGQVAMDWQGNTYWFNSTTDKMALYNKALGTIGTQVTVSGASTLDWTPSGAGEASEAFKPPIDYGDAPSTYDPSGVEPAGHDYDSLVRLGNTWSAEFAEKASTGATGDGASDDAMGMAPPVLNYNGTFTYSLTASVYNHTGASATAVAWLDYNFNGVFDAGEAVSATIATSSTSLQAITFTWTAIGVPFTSLTQTYVRIRITRSANGLTSADMNGYKPDGEVEDYSVVLGSNLPLDIITFSAIKNANATASLNWTLGGDASKMAALDVEKSTNGYDWTKIATINANTDSSLVYSYNDKELLTAKIYYRVRLVNKDGSIKYSEVRTILIGGTQTAASIYPNPAKDVATLKFVSATQSKANITVFDTKGKLVWMKDVNASNGTNYFTLDNLGTLSNGLYIVRINAGQSTTEAKLVVNKD